MDNNVLTDNWSPPSSTVSSDDETFARKGSPPPPPPPAPPQPGISRSNSESPADLNSPKKKDKKRNKITKDDEMMQLELKNVLTIYREKRRIEIPKTPEVFINQSATPTEVQDWLRVKGFSPRIQKQLAGMNGGELFKLQRAQIEEYCGKEEGRRLDSQITISRNTSGFKTARTSELRAILARARAKAEQPNGSPSSGSVVIPRPSRSYDDEKTSSRSESEASSKSPSPVKIPAPPKLPSFRLDSRSNDDDTDEDIDRHFNFSNFNSRDDDSDDDDSDDDENKGTLGRMLKEKRRQMLEQKK